MALIRERGVEAVTLRDVAKSVDTGAASLYAYFDNRDVLLEYALDAAYAEVPLVEAAEGDWRGALAATITSTITTLESYPGLGAVALGSIPTHLGALRLAEHELALMELGGLDPHAAALAIDLIAQFAAATAVEGTGRRRLARADRYRAAARSVYESAGAQQFPRVAALATALTGADAQSRRDFAIEVILSGLAQASASDHPHHDA
ncbi:hypothetical protein HMPREF1529_03010 [Microbacterium sp. oral taxon 186 str. F0373]|nr:hypothetical protein HMPREF1529_03010 [Microbacterium sp. oral taxon 186 str. F0373]